MPSFTFKKWILYSFSGWVLGFCLVLLFSVLFDVLGISGFQFVLGLGMGTGIATTQYVLLRKHFNLGWEWLLAMSACMTLPFLVMDIINRLPGVSFPASRFMLLCTALGGALSGYYFRRILKAKGKTTHWTLAAGYFLGWTFSGMAIRVIDYIQPNPDSPMITFTINVLLILSGGLIIGVLTGMPLRNLEKEYRNSNPESQ